MKPKSNSLPHTTLNFLFKIAPKIPKHLSIGISKEILGLAKKHQVRLGKTKRNMCSKCSLVLVPKITCEAVMKKEKQGFGLNLTCLGCGNSKFILKRLPK